MSKIIIPPEALSALAQELGFVQHKLLYEQAIIAMLKAWPGMRLERERRIVRQAPFRDRIILPLQETSDE